MNMYNNETGVRNIVQLQKSYSLDLHSSPNKEIEYINNLYLNNHLEKSENRPVENKIKIDEHNYSNQIILQNQPKNISKTDN